MKMAKDENRMSIWNDWVLETLDQQSGSPTVLLYTVKEEVGEPDQLTLGHPHSHSYQLHSHPHHHCRHHHNHWLGNMMTAVTWMNWMVMADLPTPPPPTTTILYLFWFILLPTLITTTTSTSSSTTPPALLLLLDSSCQAKVRVGATGA